MYNYLSFRVVTEVFYCVEVIMPSIFYDDSALCYFMILHVIYPLFVN